MNDASVNPIGVPTVGSTADLMQLEHEDWKQRAASQAVAEDHASPQRISTAAPASARPPPSDKRSKGATEPYRQEPLYEQAKRAMRETTAFWENAPSPILMSSRFEVMNRAMVRQEPWFSWSTASASANLKRARCEDGA